MVSLGDTGYDPVRTGVWDSCEIRSHTNTNSCHWIAVVCVVSQARAVGATKLIPKFLTNRSSLGWTGIRSGWKLNRLPRVNTDLLGVDVYDLSVLRVRSFSKRGTVG